MLTRLTSAKHARLQVDHLIRLDEVILVSRAAYAMPMQCRYNTDAMLQC